MGGHMKHVSIIVRADWDEEARVWVATSREIDGLAVEADTIEDIKQKVTDAISDLIQLNGLEDFDMDLDDIPVRIMSEQIARVHKPKMVA